ncbi:MAG: hypothetical protein EOP09_15030 [Proteobacteria bacterium]|nr:MAG: hypothetical protein EOP09_15030 [Pseudomonadota bacterium]
MKYIRATLLLTVSMTATHSQAFPSIDWLFGSKKPAAESQCPTAPELANGKIGLQWRTRIQTDTLQPTFEGKRLTVEIADEVKKSFDPLSGSGVASRKTCSRVLLGDENSSTPLEKWTAGSTRLLEWRPAYGYAIIQANKPTETKTIQLNIQTGSRTVLFTEPSDSCYSYSLAQSSPEGSYIAKITITRDCTDDYKTQTATVQILNSFLETVTVVPTTEFKSVPTLTWVSENAATLTDAMSSIDISVAD